MDGKVGKSDVFTDPNMKDQYFSVPKSIFVLSLIHFEF